MNSPLPSLPAAVETSASRPPAIPPLLWHLLTSHSKSPVLFPAAAARPSTLLWVWLLPQALLMFLNWRAWDLASGEMSASERTVALTIFALGCALLLGGIAALANGLIRRRPISQPVGGLLLLASAIYLGTVFTVGADAIPAAVQDWMLPPTQWMYNQFVFVGIGALYGAFRLLCPDREHSLFANSVITVAALAAPFAILLCLIGTGAMGAVFGSRMEFLRYVLAPLFLCAIFLSTGAFLRICVGIYSFARRTSLAALVGVTAVLALALPLAGLLTNSHISFPVDFQSPVIYTLAVLNGLVLCLPNFSNTIAHRAVWLAQCLTFPFTVYFFIVFLPLLPLMPLGALFFGLGLLINVPSALFLLHGCRLLDGLKAEIRDGSRWLPPVLAACAIALGPVLLTTQILRDRASLHQALDHVQYPNFEHPAFTGDRPSLRSALLNLQNFKEGRYLPLYSEFYNWLAFDNLLLPDKKLAETWTAFFGEPLPAPAKGSFNAPFLDFNGPRSASEVLAGAPQGARPSENATTESLRTLFAILPGEVRVTAQLAVANSTGTPTEYRALIHTPPGVFVTGMRLTIAGESVAAKLFEERAALWVYNKITEVRPAPRDPAILRYIAPGVTELRIYPVDSKGTRHAEIEFAYPNNLTPFITVDGRPLALPPAKTTTALRSGNGVWIPQTALAAIPPLHRTAQPYLLIDVSKNSQLSDPQKLTAAIGRALDAFPEAKTARVSFVNFETRVFQNGDSIPVEKLRTLAPSELFSAAGVFEGGLLEALAIETALTQSRKVPVETMVAEYPAVVVLRGGNAPLDLGRKDLPPFASLVPDAPSWFSLDPGAAAPASHPLDPDARESSPAVGVVVLEADGRRRVADAGQPIFLPGVKPGDTLRIYDSARGNFVPLPVTITPGTAIAAAVEPWTLANKRIFTPSAAGPGSLEPLIASARSAGVLVPSTALMVVEDTAQWKMLERIEKKAVKAHESLALAETSSTPEPGVVALLLVTGAILLARRYLSPSRVGTALRRRPTC
jgi:hypothetical protein